MSSVWIVEESSTCGEECKILVDIYATEEQAKRYVAESWRSLSYYEVPVIEPEPTVSWGTEITDQADPSVMAEAVSVGHVQDYGQNEAMARMVYGISPSTRALVKKAGNGEWAKLW